MATITQAEIKKQIEDKEYRWYCLSVVAGQEGLVVENLIERVKKQWLEEDIVDYYYPVVTETKIGKTKTTTKEVKLYPGYVFVRSRLNDKIWYVVRNTPWVRIIVGAETHPVPVTDSELENIKKQVLEQSERSSLSVPYKIGDLVTLNDGNFIGAVGQVKDIDADKGTLVVNIEMLWRLTPVMIGFDKVELVK